MISRLAGLVIEHEGNKTVVDCGGVGYGVYTLLDEQGTLKPETKVVLNIYEHIKEDSHDLYGFITKSRKDLFEKLLSVNGVGPKAALAITNLSNEGQVRASIANGDIKFISSASGVGKKVAERVVVDLKSKVGLTSSDSATDFLYSPSINEQDEALQALVALGYSMADASEVLAKVDSSLPTEQRIKQALKG